MSNTIEQESEYDEKTADAMFLAAVNPTVPHVSSIKDIPDEPVVPVAVTIEQPKPKEKPVTQKKPVSNAPVTMTTAELQLRTMQQANTQRKLYLINGRVRLEQNMGADVARQEADQTRLVWANSDDEAVSKFNNYFSDMSNASQRYTVLFSSITEALD